MDTKVQEKLYLYQILKDQQNTLLEQVSLLEKDIENSIITENTLKELKNQRGNEILASLGNNCFVRADVKDDKILIDIGMGIIVRKGIDDGISFLEDKRNEIEKKSDEFRKRLEKIEPELQNILSKS